MIHYGFSSITRDLRIAILEEEEEEEEEEEDVP